jgi:hypothetical protein
MDTYKFYFEEEHYELSQSQIDMLEGLASRKDKRVKIHLKDGSTVDGVLFAVERMPNILHPYDFSIPLEFHILKESGKSTVLFHSIQTYSTKDLF